jgi:hypothetical protein
MVRTVFFSQINLIYIDLLVRSNTAIFFLQDKTTRPNPAVIDQPPPTRSTPRVMKPIQLKFHQKNTMTRRFRKTQKNKLFFQVASTTKRARTPRPTPLPTEETGISGDDGDESKM